MAIQHILPPTGERVARRTNPRINARIRAQTLANLQRFVGADRSAIDTRIEQLRHEWDIERTLEANAASVALIGAGLGATLSKRFFALPALVAGFLLQHALQGWCPPVPVFRRFGVRTAKEIHEEILALRIMRGDFTATSRPADAYEQARTQV